MTPSDALGSHVVTLLVFLVLPVAMVVGLLHLTGRAERRREDALARQVMLTDAIHSKLGAVVAPVVRRRRGGWDLSIAAPLARPTLVAEVLAIVHDHPASRGGGTMRIVLTARSLEPDRVERVPRRPPHVLDHTWRPAVEMAGARAQGGNHVRE